MDGRGLTHGPVSLIRSFNNYLMRITPLLGLRPRIRTEPSYGWGALPTYDAVVLKVWSPEQQQQQYLLDCIRNADSLPRVYPPAPDLLTWRLWGWDPETWVLASGNQSYSLNP